MGISVEQPGSEHGIVLWRVRGQWTWEHLDQAIALSRQNVDHAHKRLDVIVDIRQMGLPPADLVAQIRQRARRTGTPQHAGLTIIVGADSHLKLLWQMLSPYLPQRWQVQFADSAAEAICSIFTNRAASEKYPKIPSNSPIY